MRKRSPVRLFPNPFRERTTALTLAEAVKMTLQMQDASGQDPAD
jgi:hypothetical protein